MGWFPPLIFILNKCILPWTWCPIVLKSINEPFLCNEPAEVEPKSLYESIYESKRLMEVVIEYIWLDILGMSFFPHIILIWEYQKPFSYLRCQTYVWFLKMQWLYTAAPQEPTEILWRLILTTKERKRHQMVSMNPDNSPHRWHYYDMDLLRYQLM